MTRFSPTNLHDARLGAGVKQEQLALDVDRTVHTISAYERGLATPSASMVAKLADRLGVTPGDLFEQGDQ